MSTLSQSYEEKKAARIERYRERAEKAQRLSEVAYQRARSMLDMIPMGQPILVGHHSEKRHRAHLARIDTSMRRSSSLQNKSDYWRRRAAAAESNRSVSSDDPEAIDKLQTKVADLKQQREKAKAANKIVRSKNLTDEQKIRKIMATLKWPSSKAAKVLQPDFCGRVGFPDYWLQNIGANIRRLEQRISKLHSVKKLSEKFGGSETIEYPGDIKLTQNYDENRTQIEFPGKPSDAVRSELKRTGFRWSRTNGVWQRHLSNAATYSAKQIIGKA